MADDLLLPTPPENLNDTEDYEFKEFLDNSQLQSSSSLPVDIQTSPQQLTDEDFDHLGLKKLDTTLLKAELSDTQLYLKNIHKGFKFARSTKSLINLVGAGLAVHKHRRQMLKDLRESKKDPFEMDEHGNLKT